MGHRVQQHVDAEGVAFAGEILKVFAVVAFPFERVAGLASTRTYELRSSFRPSYNMTVNLVRNYTRQEARSGPIHPSL